MNIFELEMVSNVSPDLEIIKLTIFFLSLFNWVSKLSTKKKKFFYFVVQKLINRL